MFSKTFGYAVSAVTYVAIHGKDGSKVGLQEISKSLDIPHHFLGKIMQDLVRHGIMDSMKGPGGGFYSNGVTSGTPLIDILKITDGSLVFNQCALGFRQCNADQPCPLHNDFAICREGMLEAMASKTVETLTNEMTKNGTLKPRH